VIAEAIELVRPLLAEKRIELRAPGDLPTVRGDRVRLREAFQNLLSNAAKFIGRRNGRIDIGCRRQAGEAVFSIRDNGPGIPPDELDRVFVPFRRLPQHRDQPGSGLGLYFTKNLIEQQGGRVWAESDVGQGACFFVALNLGRDED
jgi:signal transduction histidine kinase